MLMLNTMACAAILRRRWISGIFLEFAAAKRTLTSASGGVKSPWLMLRSHNDSEGGTILRFWCCAKNKIYTFYDNRHIHRSRGRGGTNDIEMEYEYVGHGFYKSVGSSQGWLAYEVKRNLYLIDPTTYRIIRLPPLLGEQEQVHNVVLSDQGKALMISGSEQSLSFCSPGRSHEWTLLSNAAAYESVVYSTRHGRLLCIASTLDFKLKLEAWDVGGESPSLDNVIEFDSHYYHRNELVCDSDNSIFLYMVCEEQSGKLFVVVRHVNRRVTEEEPTVGFVVYRIDEERRRLVKMENSLEGMSIFVGMNDPVAIKRVRGVQPNSIYYAHDNRIGYDRYYSGIYDYRNDDFSTPMPLDVAAGNPPWFTPRRHRHN